MARRTRTAEARVLTPPDPWPTLIAGPHCWVVLDEITIRCLAVGIVTASLEAQARQHVAALEA